MDDEANSFIISVCISKPTWVKVQCNGYSRSALKSVLKIAKLVPLWKKNIVKRVEPYRPLIWHIMSRTWWLANGQALKTGHFLPVVLEIVHYLGHLITTDAFLRLYTSAGHGSRVAAVAQESHVWLILPGNPWECMRSATTIMLNGRIGAMASTAREPCRLGHQTAAWNKTRLQTDCWTVYAIGPVAWHKPKTDRPFLEEVSKLTPSPSRCHSLWLRVRLELRPS